MNDTIKIEIAKIKSLADLMMAFDPNGTELAEGTINELGSMIFESAKKIESEIIE